MRRPRRRRPPAPSTPESASGAPPARTGRPRSQEAERAIIEATLDALAEHGVPGLNIERIAAAAGVAKTTIYRRWPDKIALVVDAIDHLKGPLPVLEGESVREDLLILARANCTSRTNRVPKIMTRVWQTAEEHGELIAACHKRISAPRRALLMSVLQRGMEEGLIRRDLDVAVFADMFVGPSVFASFSRGHVHSEDERRMIVDTLLRGVAP